MGKVVTLSELSPTEVLAFFRTNGRKAALARLKKYSKKQRSIMGKKGGRPRTVTLQILAVLKSGPKTRLEIQKATKLELSQISQRLSQLAIHGEVRLIKTEGSRKWEMHDTSAKSKAKNKDRQQKPRGQVQSEALAS